MPCLTAWQGLSGRIRNWRRHLRKSFTASSQRPWRVTTVRCSVEELRKLAPASAVPVSDETDQERAVTCALEIADQLRRRPGRNSAPTTARIGLCTGPVVATGSAADRLWGGTPVLAAALAREAKGGEVVVCARTRAALGNLFAFEDLGPTAIDKGAGTVRCFAVAAASSSDTRFEALHGYRLTPIVGRDHQVGLLESLFESARSGEGPGRAYFG